jgi:hypothetical protein
MWTATASKGKHDRIAGGAGGSLGTLAGLEIHRPIWLALLVALGVALTVSNVTKYLLARLRGRRA